MGGGYVRRCIVVGRVGRVGGMRFTSDVLLTAGGVGEVCWAGESRGLHCGWSGRAARSLVVAGLAVLMSWRLLTPRAAAVPVERSGLLRGMSGCAVVTFRVARLKRGWVGLEVCDVLPPCGCWACCPRLLRRRSVV